MKGFVFCGSNAFRAERIETVDEVMKSLLVNKIDWLPYSGEKAAEKTTISLCSLFRLKYTVVIPYLII